MYSVPGKLTEWYYQQGNVRAKPVCIDSYRFRGVKMVTFFRFNHPFDSVDLVSIQYHCRNGFIVNCYHGIRNTKYFIFIISLRALCLFGYPNVNDR